MSCSVILIANDNLLRVLGLKDVVSDTYQNDAVVVATMKNLAGDEVPGQAWPLVLTYAVNSDGDYFGILENILELKVSENYVVEITATLVGGTVMNVTKHVTAVVRDS